MAVDETDGVDSGNVGSSKVEGFSKADDNEVVHG
jgi:hypothetical protein